MYSDDSVDTRLLFVPCTNLSYVLSIGQQQHGIFAGSLARAPVRLQHIVLVTVARVVAGLVLAQLRAHARLVALVNVLTVSGV